MMNKLFVGGLSWNTTDAGLRTAFEKHGEVTEAKVINDRETGRSRGFGFVTFTTDESAQAAIAAINGTEMDGRTVRVNAADDKPQGGGRSDRSGGFGGGGRGAGGGDRW